MFIHINKIWKWLNLCAHAFCTVIGKPDSVFKTLFRTAPVQLIHILVLSSTKIQEQVNQKLGIPLSQNILFSPNSLIGCVWFHRRFTPVAVRFSVTFVSNCLSRNTACLRSVGSLGHRRSKLSVRSILHHESWCLVTELNCLHWSHVNSWVSLHGTFWCEMLYSFVLAHSRRTQSSILLYHPDVILPKHCWPVLLCIPSVWKFHQPAPEKFAYVANSCNAPGALHMLI